MAGTSASNKKSAQTARKKYGVDERGRSILHQQAGKKSAENREGFFSRLKREDPDRLAAISHRGNATKNERAKAKRMLKNGLNADEA